MARTEDEIYREFTERDKQWPTCLCGLIAQDHPSPRCSLGRYTPAAPLTLKQAQLESVRNLTTKAYRHIRGENMDWSNDAGETWHKVEEEEVQWTRQTLLRCRPNEEPNGELKASLNNILTQLLRGAINHAEAYDALVATFVRLGYAKEEAR